MTEEEAKTKWCPMTRKAIYSDPTGGFDTIYNGAVYGNCIASACMAWREERLFTRDNIKLTIHPDGNVTDNGPPPTGYCGLAGRP